MKKIIILVINLSISISFALPEKELKQKSDDCLNKKFGKACVPAGYHFEELKNHKEALRLYDQGCVLKDQDACKNADDLRNRMCFVDAISSECSKAPIDEKIKFIESFYKTDFDYQSAMKQLHKFSNNSDFRTALHRYSEKAETPFICSATKMVVSDKEFPGKLNFRQHFGSKWMIKNPKGSLSCISQLDTKQLEKMEPALTANPYENWAEDPKFAFCQDDDCRKKVVEYYNQQTHRIKQIENSADIKKSAVQFYLSALSKKIEKIKKDITN